MSQVWDRGAPSRWAPLLLAFLLAAAPALASPAGAGGGAECLRTMYFVGDDGSVNVTLVFNVSNAPANLTVEAEGAPLIAGALGPAGEELPLAIGENSVTVTVYSNGTVKVWYVTLQLTSKEGSMWTLRVHPQCEAYIVLPSDATPVEVNATSVEPAVVEGLLALKVPPGEVAVSYFQLPQTAVGGGATSTPGPGATASQGATPTAGTPGGPAQAGTATGPQAARRPSGAIIAAAAALAALAVAVALAWLRRGSPGRGGGNSTGPGSPPPGPALEAVLDDRDRAILEALRDGPKTAGEIAEATGIPKTPLYRRLKRLLEEGYIEAVQEGPVRRYRLKPR